ncbi:MAG TPA: oligosaccharide flippase family protein, partial [Dissulfurispiraceae bacterium]
YDIRTKVLIAENIFQLAGTVALVLMGYGIYPLVLWSLITALFIQIVHIRVAKHLMPLLRPTPSFTRDGIKEVFSYGIFSSVGQFLITIWTQTDRLLLGALVSASSVAYLNVPHTLAFRAVGAVGSAGSVLFPKFSALKDPEELQSLFLNATWISLCATIVIFVPVTILFPDFLRLWINPDFAAKSAWVGQVIASSCMVRGAFYPYDALFRGLGKPQYLTVLFACAALTGLGLNLALIPRFGLAGAGYCYCATPLWGFIGILFTLRKVLRIPSLRPFFHSVALPCMLGFLVLFLLSAVRRSFMETPGWIELFVIGTLFAGITAAVVLGTEQLLRGRDSYTQALARHVRRLLPAHMGILLSKRNNYGRPPEA